MIPFCLFSSLHNSTFFLTESFNSGFDLAFTRLCEYLYADFNITLFNLRVNSFQYTCEISPIMNFPYHPLTRNSILKFFQ